MIGRNSKLGYFSIIIIFALISISLFLIINIKPPYTQKEIFTIYINGNDDWETLAISESWCNGTGTKEDPYIIENISINAYKEWVDCIYISNTDAYFIIRNCTLFDSSCCYPHWCLCGIRHGMRLINVTNGKILSNHIYLNDYGIRLESCFNNSIIDNSIHNNLINLRLVNCNNNVISDNFFSSYYYKGYGGSGLILENSYYNRITNNYFNVSGIHFSDSFSFIISSNIIDTTNLIDGKPIYVYCHSNNLNSENFTNPGQIILFNCSNIIIKAFNFTSIACPVYLTHCSHFEISNNSFSQYEKRIYLEECNSGSIIKNKAINSIHFLIMINSTQIDIINNSLINNCEPITIQNSENINISFNAINLSCYSCLYYYYYYFPIGVNVIYMEDTNSSYIINNRIELSENQTINGQIFIKLRNCGNNFIEYNYLYRCDLGISLVEGCQFNIIRNNTIYFENYCIVETDSCSYNTIIDNCCYQL
ncbi:MAG: right-handed parallel beta-helix repeat-containing protein [Candidatus Odinarchaeota archaeon]